MDNCYNGYELRTNGVIGAQGSTPRGTLAANTWSNVTQETFVLNTPGANTISPMYVAANSGSPKTTPTVNIGSPTTHAYQTGPLLGIRVVTWTPFDCGGGGCGGCLMGMEIAVSSSNNNDNATYSLLSSSSPTVYAVSPDYFMFLNQQFFYKS